MLEKEKQNLSKDEYTETEAYKKLAYQWMIGHPKEEVILSIKKVLIYFTPFNFLSWRVNLFTLLVHLGFIGLTIWMVFQPLRFDIAYWILIVAPWAMVALSVLYFVEYRWRYYVEAPMLLSAFIFFRLVYDRIMGTDQRAAAVI